MSEPAPGAETCARCDRTFTCGSRAGADTCWCADLPWIGPVDPALSCLCPDCLTEEIQRRRAGEASAP